MEWKEYPPDIQHKHADSFEQCSIYRENDGAISLNRYTYLINPRTDTYTGQLEVFLNGRASPIPGKTLLVTCYSYPAFEYWDEQVEIDGLSIVSKLVPWLDSNYDT